MLRMAGEPDLRTLRLLDMAPHECVIVSCPCGRVVEYPPGLLQRRHRIPSDTLIFDLQFRLRCGQCNRQSGFRIAVADQRGRGDKAAVRTERVIVPAGP